LAAQAARLGMGRLALSDHNSLAGAVRFYRACTQAGIQPIIGAEFEVEPLTEGLSSTHLVLLAQGDAGYRSLCRLVSCANLGDAGTREVYQGVDRAHPRLTQAALRTHVRDLIALSGCSQGELPQLLRRSQSVQAEQAAHYYRELFGPVNFFVELQHHLLPYPEGHNHYRLRDLAQRLSLPVVATNNVHYATRDHAPLQDALTCLRYGRRVHEPHPARHLNREYSLKSPKEMARLFSVIPQALAATEEIASRCHWQPEIGRPHCPRFDPSRLSWPGTPLPGKGQDAPTYLRHLCIQALPERYAVADRERARQQMEHELAVVIERGLADYFLIMWDVVRYARHHNIRCTGRGSAADSLLCYLLSITQVEPLTNGLLFERFLSTARADLPDIDLDFDSRRRDEVTAYVYRRHGPDRVAAVATVQTFKARAAVRELGKALGYSAEEVAAIAKVFGHVDLTDLEGSLQRLPEVRNSRLPLKDKQLLLTMCRQVAGYPRHLATHVGGVIISPGPLNDYVPLQMAHKGLIICQYDKDDIADLGLLKMDLLSLRTHTALEHCRALLARQGKSLDLERLPQDDPTVYQRLRAGQTLGVIQLESPGQRGLLGRTQPETYLDLVTNIALFRPGPVQGGMVTPYVQRRRGRQPVTYLHPALEPILADTYGVIVYQEQVLRVAAEIGGLSLAEAEVLRRGMSHEAPPAEMLAMRDAFCAGAAQRGVRAEVAEAIWQQLAGFARYGFCRGHAASFAQIAYQAAFLKAHHPAEFFAGLLTAQPAGYYPAYTLAEEVKHLGVAILPPCVNRSEEDYTVEQGSIRCGLAAIRGMTRPGIASLLRARYEEGPYRDLDDLEHRTQLSSLELRNLVLAHALGETRLPPRLLRPGSNNEPSLPLHGAQTALQRLAWDMHLLGLSTGLSPFAPWVEAARQKGAIPSVDLLSHESGQHVRVAGIVVARSRPATRSGRDVMFLCLEDDTGLADVAFFEAAYQRFGHLLYTSPAVLVAGTLTRLGETDTSITVRQAWALPRPSAGEED